MKITYNNDIARKEIKTYILANYNKIEVKAGKCRYNFRCHNNSVHEAKRHKHKKIALVVYVDGDYPIVHFVNYNKKRFTDNTLGEFATQVDYYFIKWIKDEDMWDIFTIFDAIRQELGKQLSWWVRLSSDYRG